MQRQSCKTFIYDMLMCVAEKGDHNTTAQLRVAQKQNGRLE